MEQFITSLMVPNKQDPLGEMWALDLEAPAQLARAVRKKAGADDEDILKYLEVATSADSAAPDSGSLEELLRIFRS